MKKIFTIVMALALSMTAFGACNQECDCSCHNSCDNSCENSCDVSGDANENSENIGDSSGVNTNGGSVMTVSVAYDYGMHIEDKVTLLLNGCNLFFNPADYGITELLAGDIVKITYKGEVYIQEIYPGTVVTKDMTIIDVSVDKAKILELEVWQVPGGGYDVVYNGGTVACENPYVIYEDGTFEELGQQHVGMTLWGSDNPENSSINIQALYAYNPRPTNTNTQTPPAEHVHSLVCLEEVEPTCLYEGYTVIGCTYGDFIYERKVLEKVNCQLDMDGKCIWCEKKLSDFYTWINDLTAEDIASMQLDDVTYGVEPGMRVNSRVTSRDAQDKENMLAYLKGLELKAVSAIEGAIDGGGGIQLKIFHATSDLVCGLAIHNGYFYINGIYYRPSLELPTFGENAVIVQACCLCGSYDCTGHE